MVPWYRMAPTGREVMARDRILSEAEANQVADDIRRVSNLWAQVMKDAANHIGATLAALEAKFRQRS